MSDELPWQFEDGQGRPHGEGKQEADWLSMKEKSARTDRVWLLGVQRKLYQWSWDNPEGHREL
jgi:hypothetical protein